MSKKLHRNFTKLRSYLVMFSTFVGSLSGCGDVGIKQADDSLNISGKSLVCTEDPKIFGLYTKVMFVIDKSGSNRDTDPDRDNGKRASAIKDFLDKNRNNPYIQWGFLKFQNDKAESYIPDQGGPNRIFTADPNLMDQALDRFESESDNGTTPYRAALQMTITAVKEDLKIDSELSANYNIIFISDGVPTDAADPNIYSDVENLANLSPGNVHLSTVYYGPPSNNAEMRLERMAELGLGKYQDANQDPIINIDNLIVGGKSAEPYVIKSFVVYNLNAANCDDGTVGADSDSDGLCDRDEKRYNDLFAKDTAQKARMGGKIFDPANRNSFHPYLNDGIFYRYIAFNENIPRDCSDEKDADFDLANTCEEKYLYNRNPQGPTVNWTNEMINRSREADPYYFDSDGDGFLDMMEYLFFRNKSTAMNFNNIFDRSNGLQHDYLLLNHLNPVNPNSEVGYGIEFIRVESNSQGQNCYTYRQDNLPLYNTLDLSPFQASGSVDLSHSQNENVILIYYIQVLENNPNSKGILRYSYQKMMKDQGGAKNLSVDTSKFYIFPEPPPPPMGLRGVPR
ncbi:MAG: vWA domain-containing protein [Pseudobdellovibrionaceae bacterium]